MFCTLAGSEATQNAAERLSLLPHFPGLLESTLSARVGVLLSDHAPETSPGRGEVVLEVCDL
jgi:hypothetical protein